MTPELRDFEVFLAVARTGSFGRAATELIVSQPAVSERVRRLERVVGTAVFERTTRGAALTPAGEQLLPYAERCVALAEESVQVVNRRDAAPRFVLAVHSTFAPRLVPLVLAAMASQPRRIAVRDAHSHEVETLVVDGVADVGFAVPAPARRGLRRVAVAPDPVGVFAAPDHPLARARRTELADLRDALLAVNAWGDASGAFQARLRAQRVDEWRVRQCADPGSAVTLAREHHHVAVVASSAAAADVRARTLRPVRIKGMPRWNVRVDLVFRAGDRDDPAVQAIRRAIG
jgi:DNA-binding transcriptional LysR family regulator